MFAFAWIKEEIAGSISKLYGQRHFIHEPNGIDICQNDLPALKAEPDISDKSRYLEFILIFGVIFTVLQISDLMLTHYALKNPEMRELNPLYNQEWFIPFKLIMVLLIMVTMYQLPIHSQGLAKKAMAGMIYIYIFINLNNLYFMLK